MLSNDPDYEQEPVLLLLEASQDMDQAFQWLRGEIVLPFARQPSSDAYWTAWHQRESECRSACNEAVVYWTQHRQLPILGEDDVLFYLCRRFEQASQFVQRLFLKDGGTVFYSEISLQHLLIWLLCDWWDSHGIREAFFEDLEKYERIEEEA